MSKHQEWHQTFKILQFSPETQEMAQADQLPLKIRTLARVMRRMPTDIRKFAWWWDRMYRSIGAGGFEDDEAIAARWPNGLQGPIRNRRFAYELYLDLRSFDERRTYFSGRWYQENLEHLFALLMWPGDQYIDIGANIGLVSLMASRLIGPTGRGFSFEPNPEVFARLRRHFELNRIVNLQAVPFAVADRESETRLVVPGRASGRGSLAFDETSTGRSFVVRTVTAKPYIEKLDPAKPTIIKVDAEGYDVIALRGLATFLDSPELAIITEVNPPLLQLAGDSADSLDELMSGHGFKPLAVGLRRERFRTHFTLKEVPSLRDTPRQDWDDFLFAKPESKIYRERIAPLLASARGMHSTAKTP